MNANVFKTGQFAGVDVNDAFATAALSQSPVIADIASDIVWPKGLRPEPYALGTYRPGEKITDALHVDADVLILLYTDYEIMALLDVFTGNHSWSPERKRTWYPYGHKFDQFRNEIEGGWNDALNDGAFGYLYGMQVGTTKVVLFKNELHPKANGPKLPFVPVIQQLVGEIRPKLVISTGTAGAIGGNVNCGDVAICSEARFHVQKTYSDFKSINTLSDNHDELSSSASKAGSHLTYARDKLLPLSVSGLRECRTKLEAMSGFSFVRVVDAPKVFTAADPAPRPQPMVVVSADWLTVDDKDDIEGLQELGIMNETDDAFAFYAINRLPKEGQPSWLSIRNASEPQIVAGSFPAGTSQNAKIEKIKSLAGTIYGIYQYCTTLNSAFVCWATAADFSV